MKRLIPVLFVLLFAVSNLSAQVAAFTMNTVYDKTWATDYTLTNTTASYFTVDVPRSFEMVEQFTCNIDSASGNHTNVAVSLYGKVFSGDSWAQIGSTVNWKGTTADTTITITASTSNKYRYFKFNYVGTGTGTSKIDSQSFRVWEAQATVYNFANSTVVGGTGDAITMNFVPDLAPLTTGMEVTFIAEAANTTTVTLAIDGGAAKAIYEEGGAAPNALEANDIRQGAVVRLVYNGTQWVMISPSGN